MRRMVITLVSILAVAEIGLPADLKVTDRKRNVVEIKNAYVHYGTTRYVVGGSTSDNEHQGLRVLQGDATVTVKWPRIKELTITLVPPTSERHKHFASVPQAQIVLNTGETISAQLELGDLKGESALGEFSISLANVQRISPIGESQEKR